MHLPDGFSLPAEYVEFVKGLRHDRPFPASVLFAEPRDPGEALGRQGDNFPGSALIGRRHDTQQIIARIDWEGRPPERWVYAIVNGSEGAVAAGFSRLTDLLDFLASDPRRPG